MVAPADLSTKFALDVQAVNGLRVAQQDCQAGLEAAARQFEALFLGMMLKSMREATPRDSLMDSEQSRLYMSMLDQQLSQSMAARGVGLAEIMMRQLRDALPPEVHQPYNTADRRTQRLSSGGSGEVIDVAAGPADLSGNSSSALPAERTAARSARSQQPLQHAPELELQSESQTQPTSQSQLQPQRWPLHVTEFRDRVMAYAQEASQVTGIPARFVLGQAALESGWGRRELRAADGTPSHNLFGIKASGNWRGRVVEATTTSMSMAWLARLSNNSAHMTHTPMHFAITPICCAVVRATRTFSHRPRAA